MSVRIITRSIAVPLLISVLSLCWVLRIAVAGAKEDTGYGSAIDPRLDMIAALKALGPHPSLGEQAKVFGRLVGTWDVEYTDFSKDGTVSQRAGELVIGWVMDGRAIQDLWVVYPSAKQKEREVYTDLRYFDPKSQTWLAIFIDPKNASVTRFTGGAMGDNQIVLDTSDLGNPDTRWSFNDIRSDSLVFRDEASSDSGKTWKLQSEYHMKRRGAAAPAQ